MRKIRVCAHISLDGVISPTARGEDTEDSDLDLLIDAPPGFSLFDLMGLELALEALLNVPVDISTGKFRNERIATSVANDACPLGTGSDN